MVRLEARRTGAIRYLPGGFTVGLAVVGTTGMWLLALAGLIGAVIFLPDRPWPARLSFVALCGAAIPAVWATRQVVVLRRVRHQVPAALLSQVRHGNLTSVAADDSRPLRPVGMTVDEVVARTDALVGRLSAIPSVRIFQGVQPPGAARPVATHAVSAGRLLILVDSVAWPPGSYRTDATGRVRCDGQYIGQSVQALTMGVRSCRALLPRTHRVFAYVVVHPVGSGEYTLPGDTKLVHWTLADRLSRELEGRVVREPATVSRHTIAALTASPAPTPAVSPAGEGGSS